MDHNSSSLSEWTYDWYVYGVVTRDIYRENDSANMFILVGLNVTLKSWSDCFLCIGSGYWTLITWGSIIKDSCGIFSKSIHVRKDSPCLFTFLDRTVFSSSACHPSRVLLSAMPWYPISRMIWPPGHKGPWFLPPISRMIWPPGHKGPCFCGNCLHV